MFKQRSRRSKFSNIQLQKDSEQICFRNVTNMFNCRLKQKMKYYPRKRIQILKQRYYHLERLYKSEWKYQHEKLMLKLVSKGKSWSQISKKQVYKQNNFNNNYIKKQFETCQRIKVRALTSYFLNQFCKQISDKTLQIIICQDKIKYLYDKCILSYQEYENLIRNSNFLMLCRMDQVNQKISLRKKQAKKNIFIEYGLLQNNNGKILAQIIVKIDNFIKNNYEQFQIKEQLEYLKINDGDKQTDINTVININNQVYQSQEEKLINYQQKQDYQNQYQSNLQFSIIHLDSEDQQLDKYLRNIFQNQ